MRLTAPRIAPLADADFTEAQRDLLEKGGRASSLNIFRTLVRHPDLYRRWMVFGNHVLAKSTLDARTREILVLRVGHLCQCAYEFHQHTAIGKRAGLQEVEIENIKLGPGAPGWTAHERALLQAVDELRADTFISDPTWATLSQQLTIEQMYDLIFTVGQYVMVCMALNSLGVQIERETAGR